jgi:hypothetical protein
MWYYIQNGGFIQMIISLWLINFAAANFTISIAAIATIQVHAIPLLIQYPRWDILYWMFLFWVACAKDAVPKTPVEGVVASTVMMMFDMTV